MQAIKSPIYKTAQIKEFERLAQERFSITEEVMMQRAGKAAFDFMVRRWPQVQKIAVFCGGGNNGGDGYVLALLAEERGLKVTAWQVGAHEKLSAQTQKAKVACEKANIPMPIFSVDRDLGHPELVIDAICGIGLQQNLRDDIALLVEKIQRLQVPILAIDIPTGISADTGHIQGNALSANATISFIGLKVGLLTGSGIAHAGELVANELQLPSDLFNYVEPVAEKISLNAYANYLKARPRDWHKGLSGHVLVVGGAPGFSGAPRMSASAALRCGAGLATVATTRANALSMNSDRPELMCHGIENISQLEPLVDKADVIVIGPGLGQDDWGKMLCDYVFKQDIPLVVDADALNLLSTMNLSKANWVLTPHPGEAARLLGMSVAEIQADRLAASCALNKKFGGVTILKGAGTVIYAPNTLPAICDKGNPGMASAGMGDILSGVIAGWISQGLPLSEAAKLGVCLHAAAGDIAAKEGERGMLAMDLMAPLRRLSNIT